ncbi:phage portal protein [Denitromonas halophila]|uniref:Phage portal protein n=1 Tax=Denitromonas halophila TaxID=1629404 RepID=A0A557QJS9_9RHOO|nr:phage portal protein [Denitromonas halophila]TVO53165.1 phage portal protein [Denitromonas halophila]
MNVFGFEITRKSATPSPVPTGSGGWFPVLREATSGAWQRGETIEVETALAHSAVFACASLIANDIGKLPIDISAKAGRHFSATEHEYSALLRRPNRYQNRLQFFSAWALSKLFRGNAYILKQRNAAGKIEALHVLDAQTVTVLVSDDGAVFYQIKRSNIAGIAADVTVPAREIIHDRGITPHHPLVGISPLTAAGLAAMQGVSIQRNSAKFFENGSQPGGILTAPGQISNETAQRLKAHWEANYTGQNFGKTAVLGDGIQYETMTVSAVDSQLIEQLNFTAQDVCRAFNVPAWKISAGPAAPYTSNEQMNLSYYCDALQHLIEAMELALDDGLDLPPTIRTEFDESQLMRMDTTSRYAAHGGAINARWMTINEVRSIEGYPPVAGGDEVLRQLQDVPLSSTTQDAAVAQ